MTDDRMLARIGVMWAVTTGLLPAGCVGIEHEDIGSSGTAASGEDGELTAGSETGDEGDADAEGDDGEPKLDLKDGMPDAGSEDGPAPRLFVAAGSGVRFYSDLAAIQGDVAADGVLSGTSGDARGLAIGGDRLFVAGDDLNSPLFVFDDADALADGAGPDVVVPVAGFGDVALTTVHHMEVDAQGNLWIVDGDVRLFLDAADIDGASNQAARFMGGSLVSSAFEPDGAKLIGADSAGTDLPVWNAPLGASGDTGPDWVLDIGGMPASLAVHDKRLYVAGQEALLRVWADVDQLVGPAAPGVTINAPNADLTAPSHVFLRDDVLVVCNDGADGEDLVAIYTDVAGLQNDATASFLATDLALDGPAQAILDSDATLYVLVSDGIMIFDDVTSAPSLRAHVTMDIGAPNDIALMECWSDMACAQGSCVSGLCVP